MHMLVCYSHAPQTDAGFIRSNNACLKSFLASMAFAWFITHLWFYALGSRVVRLNTYFCR